MAVTEARPDLLGSGGEADVYVVPGRPDLAEKRWRNPTFEQARKLELMLAHPPEGAVLDGHVNLAWPVSPVRSPGGGVVGFRMPAVDLRRSVPVFSAYNPHARREEMPGITWRHLVRTGRNLASVIAALHRAGYVVGDLNESNVLVDRRALVTILDCDSIQVSDPATGEVHHCGVARPDFLAPELAGKDLSSTRRTQAADRFALAVMVFLLLREGVHPYAGVWRGRGEPPDLSARMRGRRFPHLPGSRLRPPPHSLGMAHLGWRLRWMFLLAFVIGPMLRPLRPSAAGWDKALGALESRLEPCARSPLHLRPRRHRCPWCERVDTGLPDPFPDSSGSGVRARTPGRLAAAYQSTRRRLRRSARAVGGWAWARTSGVRRVAPASAAIIAFAVSAPSALAVSVAVTAGVIRWRTGSFRRTGGVLTAAARSGVRRCRPVLWWILAATVLGGHHFGSLGY